MLFVLMSVVGMLAVTVVDGSTDGDESCRCSVDLVEGGGTVCPVINEISTGTYGTTFQVNISKRYDTITCDYHHDTLFTVSLHLSLHLS